MQAPIHWGYRLFLIIFDNHTLYLKAPKKCGLQRKATNKVRPISFGQHAVARVIVVKPLRSGALRHAHWAATFPLRRVSIAL